jgi:hypothetical protein
MGGSRWFPPTVDGWREEKGELVLTTIDPARETDIPTGKRPSEAVVGQ